MPVWLYSLAFRAEEEAEAQQLRARSQSYVANRRYVSGFSSSDLSEARVLSTFCNDAIFFLISVWLVIFGVRDLFWGRPAWRVDV